MCLYTYIIYIYIYFFSSFFAHQEKVLKRVLEARRRAFLAWAHLARTSSRRRAGQLQLLTLTRSSSLRLQRKLGQTFSAWREETRRSKRTRETLRYVFCVLRGVMAYGRKIYSTIRTTIRYGRSAMIDVHFLGFCFCFCFFFSGGSKGAWFSSPFSINNQFDGLYTSSC